jgi:AcrR family transcriptional regulator
MRTTGYVENEESPMFLASVYGQAGMVVTPWGDAADLRDRRLPPGRNRDREAVARNQRERLMAAMVAVVSEKGYEATSVAALLALSGVSRSAFYKHFSDKRGCFVATVEAIVEMTLEVISHRYAAPGTWEERARRALEDFVKLIVAQPAAARLCLVDVYAAGPAAVGAFERAMVGFEDVVRRALEGLPGREGIPPELVRAIVSGLRKVVHTRLLRGKVGELPGLVPELWEWGLSYRTPPRPLTEGRRISSPPAAPWTGNGEPAERIIAATMSTIARQGYAATKVTDIVAEASVSLSTFYECFEGKEDALAATLDAGQAQMLAAALPAYRRARTWPEAVRAGIAGLFLFLCSRPDFARLATVEIYAMGQGAIERRDRTVEALQRFLEPGFEYAPRAPAVAPEAIGGAIHGLLYDLISGPGPAAIPGAIALATFVTLAPFLGTEDAYAIARGDRSAVT